MLCKILNPIETLNAHPNYGGRLGILVGILKRPYSCETLSQYLVYSYIVTSSVVCERFKSTKNEMAGFYQGDFRTYKSSLGKLFTTPPILKETNEKKQAFYSTKRCYFNDAMPNFIRRCILLLSNT